MSAVGTWAMTMETPMGKQEATLTLNEDGTGLLKSMMGEIDITGVVYDGNDVSLSADMGPVSIELSGTADGDSFSGTAKSPMGDSPVVGVRA